MKYGFCVPFDEISNAKKAGFDYVELSLSNVTALSENEFSDLIKTLGSNNISSKVMNGFFPGTLKIVGEIDRQEITDYMKKALDRAKLLGAKTVVFGSGRSRNIPDSEDRDKCISQLTDIIREAGELASERKIKIVIEPLNRKETNVANTVSEAVELVKSLDHPNVSTMVDFYHFSMNGEKLDELLENAEYISHIHIARGSEDRGVPTLKDKEWLTVLADTVKKIGYDSCITVEARTTDLSVELPAAREALKIFG